MRWIAKAAALQALDRLPGGDRVHYFVQRHVQHGLPISDRKLRRKFDAAAGHLDAFLARRPGTDPATITAYEFGAGWTQAVPLSLAALGVGQQVLLDIRPHLRLDQFNHGVARLNHLRPELEQATGRAVRDLGGPFTSLAEVEDRLGIVYRAPCDARSTGLDSGSVDLVTSTVTCEHIAADVLTPIFAECHRILRGDGVLACTIDLQDHYANFDRSITRYNFLKFSERTWSLANPGLHYQNRLRASDYLRALDDAGFDVDVTSRGLPDDPTQLGISRVAPRFAGYEAEDLATFSLRLSATPRPAA